MSAESNSKIEDDTIVADLADLADVATSSAASADNDNALSTDVTTAAAAAANVGPAMPDTFPSPEPTQPREIDGLLSSEEEDDVEADNRNNYNNNKSRKSIRPTVAALEQLRADEKREGGGGKKDSDPINRIRTCSSPTISLPSSSSSSSLSAPEDSCFVNVLHDFTCHVFDHRAVDLDVHLHPRARQCTQIRARKESVLQPEFKCLTCRTPRGGTLYGICQACVHTCHPRCKVLQSEKKFYFSCKCNEARRGTKELVQKAGGMLKECRGRKATLSSPTAASIPLKPSSTPLSALFGTLLFSRLLLLVYAFQLLVDAAQGVSHGMAGRFAGSNATIALLFILGVVQSVHCLLLFKDDRLCVVDEVIGESRARIRVVHALKAELWASGRGKVATVVAFHLGFGPFLVLNALESFRHRLRTDRLLHVFCGCFCSACYSGGDCSKCARACRRRPDGLGAIEARLRDVFCLLAALEAAPQVALQIYLAALFDGAAAQALLTIGVSLAVSSGAAALTAMSALPGVLKPRRAWTMTVPMALCIACHLLGNAAAPSLLAARTAEPAARFFLLAFAAGAVFLLPGAVAVGRRIKAAEKRLMRQRNAVGWETGAGLEFDERRSKMWRLFNVHWQIVVPALLVAIAVANLLFVHVWYKSVSDVAVANVTISSSSSSFFSRSPVLRLDVPADAFVVFVVVVVLVVVAFIVEILFGLVFCFDFSGERIKRLMGGYLLRMAAFRAKRW